MGVVIVFMNKDLRVQSSPEAGGKNASGGWLHRFALLTIALTLFLLIVGALVTSNEAGDSVPDWPLSFGRWLIDSQFFIGNIRYEYSHRFIAGCVGFATFILAVWVSIKDKRRWMKGLAWIAFGGVVAQALLGGVRVLLGEQGKLYISVPHALVAQSFFGTLVAIAVFTSKSWAEPLTTKLDSASLPLRRMTALSIAAVLAQLVLGAGFRHRVFGIIPHVIGAIVVAFLILWTVTLVMRRHGRNSYLRKPAMVLYGLLFAQLGLGVCAYLARLAMADSVQPLEPMITLTVAHVAVGAMTLATLILLTLRCYRALAPRGERVREVAGASASAARRATA